MKIAVTLLMIVALSACSTGSDSQLPGDDARAEPDIAGETSPQETVEQPTDLAEPDEGSVEEVADGGGGDTGSGWKQNYGKGCSLEDRVGHLKVRHDPDEGYVVAGNVKSSVIVGGIRVPSTKEGKCTMMVKVNPFCDPACDPSTQQCSLAEKCEPNPENLDVGSMTITGMGEEVAIEPNPNNDYWKFDFKGEAFVAGDEIELSTDGGALPSFTLQGHGVDLVELTGKPEMLTPGAPLQVDWTPSDGPGDIFVMVSIGNHAVSPASIFCETDDSGSFAIPASLVDELLLDWIAGTITATWFRRTVDSEQFEEGCVEFQVRSEVTWELGVDI